MKAMHTTFLPGEHRNASLRPWNHVLQARDRSLDAASADAHWPPYLVPSPQGVFESLRAGFADHSFWIAIAISMKRIAIGYSISVAVGIVLGWLLASSEFLEQTLGGLLVSLQSPPASVGCRWRSCGLDCPRRRFFSS